jgi:hypothetical protein
MWTFTSLMVFSQSALFFLPLLQICNVAFINICLYTIPHSNLLSSSLISYPFPLSWSIPLSLTVPKPQIGFLTACLGWQVAFAQPPNLEGQSTVFITAGAGWPNYALRHRVPILVAFYDLHGLQWDYSFLWSPHGELLKLCVTFILSWHSNFDKKNYWYNWSWIFVASFAGWSARGDLHLHNSLCTDPWFELSQTEYEISKYSIIEYNTIIQLYNTILS